jgi:ABC-type multidrug transport system fused ATPase/permease subunit
MLGEGGSGLSGGQRQRLAIARALVRDPSVLILDEATSQIDAESEAQISAAIDDFRAGRTVIAIAHRLSTVRSADRIVVMEDGRVLDVGTHGQLLTRCDLYRRLVQTQLVG